MGEYEVFVARKTLCCREAWAMQVRKSQSLIASLASHDGRQPRTTMAVGDTRPVLTGPDKSIQSGISSVWLRVKRKLDTGLNVQVGTPYTTLLVNPTTFRSTETRHSLCLPKYGEDWSPSRSSLHSYMPVQFNISGLRRDLRVSQSSSGSPFRRIHCASRLPLFRSPTAAPRFGSFLNPHCHGLFLGTVTASYNAIFLDCTSYSTSTTLINLAIKSIAIIIALRSSIAWDASHPSTR